MNSAETYADSGSAQALTDANAYTDWRVNQLSDQFNRRMARTGAAASALGLMAGTAAAIHDDDTLAGALTTFQGRPAAAFGVQHHFSDRVAMTIGASFAGGDQNTAGVAFAVGLH
ncbi:YadA-like family protein [Acidomonas methanolica]|uniref:YadA-like family protein n=1 Tax=Acidomonas methanolica TaxID=437 RepID=UPI00211A69CE|nr:YadA-like family protein [Acidomonas methanolica]MCQ9157049.1 YadA-like family protein [Acidomonas methanolica]